ncbi:MAG: aminotransferase class I/II-fold pyridoxal phosphate-dependent enzyme [Candidatus Omnitrophota bacterium]|jgi:aminotransferase
MISKHIKNLAPSGIRQFFDLVLGMPEVISLGVGEPDFVTPWRIRERAITAIEEGMTSYTSNKGLFVLRQAVSNFMDKRHSLQYDPEEEILITVGVSEGLDLAIRAIVSRGDKVIVVSPHFVAYPALVEISGGSVIYIPTRQENNFKIDIKKLKEALKANPKAIILNNPSNPTGASYDAKELYKIWEQIKNKDTIVISDEVYDELVYDGKTKSFPALDEEAKKRTILLNGFSKAYAMTGFRLGYACANKEIIEAMNKIHSFSMMCAPIVSQVAAVEALKAQKDVLEMRNEYKRRRNFIVKEFNRIGMKTPMPTGAFYCFPSIEKFKIGSLEFAKRLLFEEKVAVVPGTAFGKEYDSFVRISYATSLDNLKEAIIRIGRFLGKL